MRTHRAAALLAVFLAMASPAAAQRPDPSWYAGVGLGGTQTRFDPYYTFSTQGDPEQFENRASGWHVDVVAGRRVPLTDRLALSIQGAASVNRIAWTLSLPEEPADLRYSLPYIILAGTAASARIGQQVSAFAEVGAGTGRVREIKTSPVRSSYAFDEMRRALTAGGGLAFSVTPRAALVTAYRYVRYAALEYDTFGPSGALVEHVEDLPATHAFTAGVTMTF